MMLSPKFYKFLLFTFLLHFAPVSAQNFTDSNLPIVIINTDINDETGQPHDIVDDPRVLASMKIIKRPNGTRNYLSDQNTAAFLNYDGRINIEIRGSSSQELPKKPYGLTTLQADNVSNNNVSLLGMPSENDWVLNSLAFDASLMRDYISYYLARQMGNYAPRTEYCEVVINGEYVGLYMLQEKIKADSNRVNIVKITEADNSLPNLSGGYITKADKTTGGDPVAWTMPSYNWSTEFIHDLPKPEDVTPQQNNYIHAQFTNLATVAANDNLNLSTGIPSVIDIPTFIDFMIIAELSSNVDAYQLSTYFHKDRSGKLRAGPIWDYNLTYGNDLPGWDSRSEYDVWQFDNDDNTGAKFWKDLFDNPTYKCYLSRRWNALTGPEQPLKHNNLVILIDNTVNYISESIIRENQKWDTVSNHATEIENLKVWLYQRINWITSHIGTFTSCNNVPVPPLVINKINYNPGTDGSFPLSNDQEFIEIKNAGSTAVNLTGIYFRELGISFQFPTSTVTAGQSVYLASDMATFQSKYGFAAFGQFTRNLSNNSQKLVLADAFGNIIDSVEYDDELPWPDADGNGSYLQLINTSLDNSLASSWTTSTTALSVVGFEAGNASVYPNPVSEILLVKSPKAIEKVDVYDVCGKLLQTLPAQSDAMEIDFRDFSKGLYLVKISFDGGTTTQKVIRQ